MKINNRFDIEIPRKGGNEDYGNAGVRLHWYRCCW